MINQKFFTSHGVIIGYYCGKCTKRFFIEDYRELPYCPYCGDSNNVILHESKHAFNFSKASHNGDESDLKRNDNRRRNHKR